MILSPKSAEIIQDAAQATHEIDDQGRQIMFITTGEF